MVLRLLHDFKSELEEPVPKVDTLEAILRGHFSGDRFWVLLADEPVEPTLGEAN